jgi:(2Fe-2S) ferredoxin
MSAKKIKTQSELQALAKKLFEKDSHYKAHVLICMTGCRALGAQDVAAKFRQRLKELELEDKYTVVNTGCIGMCALAPAMVIEPYNYLYGGVKPEDVDDIINITLEQGKPVERFIVSKTSLFSRIVDALILRGSKTLLQWMAIKLQ